MSNAKFVAIARLMTKYDLEIDNEVLPDNLKCVKCKLVLKDACQVPCGCRFCLLCIEDMIASGSEFCPGISEDCGESLLSGFATDFRANKSVSKLPVKCPKNGCLHKCRLAELGEHIRLCGRMSVVCPFQELGCLQDKLAAEEMSAHFHLENRTHSEILVGMISDINRELDSHKREIEMLKRNDESRKTENEMLKCDLAAKDEQIRMIIDQLEHVENENKSIRDEIKSIKEEKENLADRVLILSEKIEREISIAINYVDKKTTAVIESNKDEHETMMRSFQDDIRSINQDRRKSIKSDIDCIKSQMQSIQALVGLGQIDASCEWLIDVDVRKKRWEWADRTSELFTGAVHSYKYKLASWNYISRGELWIFLRILYGVSDSRLAWPFRGTMTITVADKNKREACQVITGQCNIERPADNDYSDSAPFKFLHPSLMETGVDLARGVRISCVIILSGAGR